MTTTRKPGRRQAQAAYRRELLVQTAYRLFAERGYRATSVRDITHAADVTEAVLYHYFANKADLLRAVLATYSPLAGFQSILGETDALPAGEMLTRLGAAFLRLVRERRAFVAILLSEAPEDPDLGGALGDVLGAALNGIATSLRQRQERGDIAAEVAPVAVARALQGGLLVHFLTTAFQPAVEVSAAEDERVVRDLVAALMTGLRSD